MSICNRSYSFQIKSEIQCGVCMRALESRIIYSTLSRKSFPNVVLVTVAILVWLKQGLFCPFGEDCQAVPFSMPQSLLQVINSVTSLALCPQVVSHAPQRFGSFEMQVTCDGCCARQLSICSVVPSSGSSMSRATHPQSLQMDVRHCARASPGDF